MQLCAQCGFAMRKKYVCVETRVQSDLRSCKRLRRPRYSSVLPACYATNHNVSNERGVMSVCLTVTYMYVLSASVRMQLIKSD